MSSGTSIIEGALIRIKAHSVAKPAAPETIENCMGYLNSMMEIWKSKYIDIGVSPLSAPGDELGEPVDTTNAIKDCLAIHIAPDFNTIPTRELKSSAAIGFGDVKKLYQVIPIPKKVVSSTMPLGQGNNRFPLNRGIFAGEDFELDA